MASKNAKPPVAKTGKVAKTVKTGKPVVRRGRPRKASQFVESMRDQLAPVAVGFVAPVADMIEETAEALAPRLNEGKVKMNDTIKQAEEAAKKYANEATERATAAMGEFTTRAKAAAEKGSKTVEQIVDFQKGNVEAVVEAARIAAKGGQDFAKHAVELGRKALEDTNGNVKKLAAAKSPTEFFQIQSELAKTSLDTVVAETSKFTEDYLKFVGEVFQPIQNRYAVAVEKVKSAYAA